MIAQWLGQTAAPSADFMVSGKWLIAALPVIASAVAVVIKASKDKWKSLGAREATTSDVTIKKPVPVIETKEKPVLATKSDLDASIRDNSTRHNDCRKYQSDQHHNIHRRIDAMSERFGERLANVEGTSKSTNEIVSKLLDIAMGKKPSTRQ